MVPLMDVWADLTEDRGEATRGLLAILIDGVE